MHTPGPWKITIDGTMSGRWPFIYAGDDHEDCTIAELGTVETSVGNVRRRWKAVPERGEIMANASLIAAAPDLLAACKAAKGTLGMEQDCTCNGNKTDPCSYCLICAAIRKAEGDIS